MDLMKFRHVTLAAVLPFLCAKRHAFYGIISKTEKNVVLTNLYGTVKIMLMTVLL